MNVYPVNALEASTMESLQIESYSSFTDLYNRYMSYQIDFNSEDIEIAGTWEDAIELDTIILGNTNAQSGRIRLYHGNELLHDITFNINDYITILETGMKNVDKFILNLSGADFISIGYLFTGMRWKLPRFVIEPGKSISLRNESNRTFSGQVTGIPIDTLKTFKASFIRIPNEQKEIYDNYIDGVQTVIPHVIDPYPEAHEQFQPFFATVESYGEAIKRAENGFYWNFDCSWMEAK